MSTEQTVQTTNQAVDLLVQAARLAQNRGAFNLDEASVVSQAVRFLIPPAPAAVSEETGVSEENVEEESE